MRKLIPILLVLVCAFSAQAQFGKTMAFRGSLKPKAAGGGGGGGTFTFLTHAAANASGSSTATTPAKSTVGAGLIILCVSSVAAVTVSDVTTSQTLTPATSFTDAPYIVRFYYVVNPTTSATHQFSAQGTAAFAMIDMECFSYTGGTPTLDNENGNHLAVGTSLQVGAISSTTGGRVSIIGLTTQGTGDTYAADNSFSNTDSGIGAGAISLSMAYLLQTSGASVNPTWTLTGGAEAHLAANGIAFK